MPGIGDVGPYSRFYLRNPGFHNHDLSLFKNFPLGASGKRTLQLRLEAFNVLNSAAVLGRQPDDERDERGGPDGRGDLQQLHGPDRRPTTRARRAARRCRGPFFGEYNATRDPRIIQLGVKLYF